MSTLDLEQAAELAKCHPDTLRRLMKSGEIPGGWKRGREWRIDGKLLEKWIARRCRANTRMRRASFRAARRKAALLLRTPAWADMNAIRDIYDRCERMCRDAGPGRTYHVDHVIPLQGETVSGLHVHENLRIIPARDNRSKHNRFEA